MTIIFDLDYTLLDTALFKEAVAGALAECGLTREDFSRTYKEVTYRPGALYDYNHDLQLNLLSESLTCDKKTAKEKIYSVAARCGEFIYPGALDFLKRLRVRGFKLILLTLGNAEWQKKKIAGCGLASYFDEIITTTGNKASLIKNLEKDIQETTAVINDNGDEVREMVSVAPQFHYIIKKGPKPAPPDLKIPVCETFDEIENIIYEIANR